MKIFWKKNRISFTLSLSCLLHVLFCSTRKITFLGLYMTFSRSSETVITMNSLTVIAPFDWFLQVTAPLRGLWIGYSKTTFSHKLSSTWRCHRKQNHKMTFQIIFFLHTSLLMWNYIQDSLKNGHKKCCIKNLWFLQLICLFSIVLSTTKHTMYSPLNSK